MRTKKHERDAEAARVFLELIGWTGEFHLPTGLEAGVLDRFWAKVRVEDDHWLWTASTSSTGAGQFGAAYGRVEKAHRMAWTFVHGPIADGMAIARQETCPHPHCVRPDHYSEITMNEAASVAGKRGGRGNFKSTPEAIPVNCSQNVITLLRAMHAQGSPLLEVHRMGLRLGLGPATIQHIIKGNARGVR